MDGWIKTFSVAGRWWQWARYECDQKDYVWLFFVCLCRWFDYLNLVDSVKLNGGNGYTVWCDTLVELQFVFNINRCKLIKPQIDPSTDSYIKYIKWLQGKKHTKRYKKRRRFTRSQAKWLFCMRVSDSVWRDKKRQTHQKTNVVEKIYLLKIWFDRL